MFVIFFFVLFAVKTYERNIDWSDEETLYKFRIIQRLQHMLL